MNQGDYARALSILRPFAEAPRQYPTLYSDYIVALFRNGDAPQAIRRFETMPASVPRRVYLKFTIAEAYYDTGDFAKAIAMYRSILDNAPDDETAMEGLARSLVAAGQPRAAVDELHRLFMQPGNKPAIDLLYPDLLLDLGRYRAALDAYDRLAAASPATTDSVMQHRDRRIADLDEAARRHALAYADEKAKDSWAAIRTYDHILRRTPGDTEATRLRIKAYANMGASRYALALAEARFPQDREMAARLKADAAVDHIRWEEPAIAEKILRPLCSDPGGDRYDYDRIVALARDNRCEESIALYESPALEGKAAPPWVLENVAGAYLCRQQPETALGLYNAALSANPASINAQKGKRDTLQELRQWTPLHRLLDEMDAATPTVVGTGAYRHYNPEKLNLAIARGWALVYENRLRDADAYFGQLQQEAPGNPEIRNALAHIHHWRGWPRRALEEFNILHSMDPDYLQPETGRIATLNDLAFKSDAREQAKALLKQHPREKWVRKLVRELDVEQFNRNDLAFSFSKDDDGATDVQVMNTTSTPLSLWTRLYGFVLWRRTWNDDPDETARALGDDQATYFKRIGAGLNHIFNSDWRATQQFSVDVETGGEFGSLSQLTWTPDDYWQIDAMVDTFSTDVAKRARAAGITAQKAETRFTFRESEWREYSLSLSRQRFSDDNDRDEISAGYEQNLFVKNDWRMRIFLDLYGTRNSEWDNPDVTYFNPKSALGCSLTHMTEQTVYDIYDRRFVHRLYLTAGSYAQDGYSGGPVGAIRYEQEFDFSDTHALLWGVGLARDRYDGDSVDSLGFDLAWTLRF